MTVGEPERKAWIASRAEAQDFAEAHGGNRMTPENRAIFEAMMARAATAAAQHEVVRAATMVIARAEGIGRSLAGRRMVVAGIALTYIGILWMVLYYVSGGEIPVASIGDTNTVIGTCVMVPGVVLWVAGAALRASGRRRVRS